MTGHRPLGALFALSLLVACGGSGGGGVSAVNRAPTITGVPSASINAGAPYSFQPSATDPDGDPIRFSIEGQPSWADFDPVTGALTGTPINDDVGVYEGIVIRVNDGASSAVLPQFSISVVAMGRPQITGSPPARATVGQTYSFTPLASDPDEDGNELGFSVRNLPKWARFDSALGRVYGVPTAADVGTYASIRISVTDSTHTVSLPDFSITVEAQSTGQATVSWLAPTENTDGSALTDLGGYVIFFGQTPADLVQARNVSGIGATSLVIENLAQGTWYFQMIAFNVDNIESPRTAIVSRAIL